MLKALYGAFICFAEEQLDNSFSSLFTCFVCLWFHVVRGQTLGANSLLFHVLSALASKALATEPSLQPCLSLFVLSRNNLCTASS